jgi:hypothetical protein
MSHAPRPPAFGRDEPDPHSLPPNEQIVYELRAIKKQMGCALAMLLVITLAAVALVMEIISSTPQP